MSPRSRSPHRSQESRNPLLAALTTGLSGEVSDHRDQARHELTGQEDVRRQFSLRGLQR